MAQVDVEIERKDRKRLWAGLLGAAAVTSGGLALGQIRVLRNQAKLLAKQERGNALKKAILESKDEEILQRAANLAARETKKVKPKNEGFKNWERGITTPRPTPQAQHASGKKKKIGTIPPKSGRVETEASGHFRSEESNWRKPSLHPNKDQVKFDPDMEQKVGRVKKQQKKTLARLVKLIELDTLNVTRDKSGQFSGSGAPTTDPASMQAAYLLPRMNGSSPVMQAPRGRGRPPGSLNKSTVMRQEAAQNAAAEEVVAEAGSQQPEFQEEVIARQERRESGISKKAIVAAGLAAGGALVLGPRIAKGVGQARAEQKGIARILGKLGTELKPSSQGPYRGLKARPVVEVKRDSHGNPFSTYRRDPANNDLIPGNPVFGERLATKSVGKEVPIESLARERVRGIREAIQRNRDKAAEWDRKNKGKRMPYENPFRRNKANYEARQAAGVPEPQIPLNPAERRTRKTAQDRRADKETAARWKAEAQSTRANKDLTAAELKNKQDAKKAEDKAREQRDKIGSMSDEMKELKKKAGETEEQFKKRQADTGRSAQLRAAEDVLDMMHGRKPMNKKFAEIISAPENEALRQKYPARIGPSDVRTAHQGDLFDVRNAATRSHTGPLPSTVAEERVVREKAKFLRGGRRLAEVEEIAQRHGLDVDALAEVMARRRVRGESARVAPSVPLVPSRSVATPTGVRPPGTSQERQARDARIRTRDEELLKSDRALHADAKIYEDAAWSARRDEINATRKSGVRVDKDTMHREEIAVRAEARRKWARQKRSEGKIGDIRGLPVGSDTPTAREIAYADTRLVIRLSSALKRIEFAAS